VPHKQRRRKEALRTAERLASSIPGLKGYVGVDLVLTPGEAFVMEVNPRITTSYLGARKVVQENIARHIFDACTKGVTPGKVRVKGGAAFRKTSINIESADWKVSINKEHFIVCHGRNVREALVKAGIQS
ncbi:MAG: ATP-grasp domain-containing protein, partial [Candidatus Jordarchaeales archaeon]